MNNRKLTTIQKVLNTMEMGDGSYTTAERILEALSAEEGRDRIKEIRAHREELKAVRRGFWMLAAFILLCSAVTWTSITYHAVVQKEAIVYGSANNPGQL